MPGIGLSEDYIRKNYCCNSACCHAPFIEPCCQIRVFAARGQLANVGNMVNAYGIVGRPVVINGIDGIAAIQ
ncbi:hypothetical protein [Methanosarcina acetivorans]|uniref:hypothetical protein n=1 Tax=Methanosarcina acetivorans TaxID=2214 RepID=UPI001D0470E4|nr:hypothetical protein [Methanosarcina acetivorans]